MDDYETALCAANDRLRETNAALLAACEAVMGAMNIPGPPLPIDVMLELRAAIAKASS